MQISASGITDIGQKRETNEDAFLVDEQLQLYVVCDGMGGHAAGEVASRKATELLAEYVRDHAAVLNEVRSSNSEHYKVIKVAEAATIETCRQLHELASSQPEYAGMGTTMTMLIIVGSKALMSHVGDSRLYLLRDKELHLLSSDHTMANDMLQRGMLTPAEFETHPFRHYLTRSVGSAEAVEPEILLFDIIPSDTLLLCSDGLSRYIEDSDEMTHLLRHPDLDTTLQALVKVANERGGHDNITAIVVQATSEETADDENEDTRVKVQALQSMFLCDKMSYRRVIRLVEISQLRTYYSGESVLRENDSCDGLYLIVGGRMRVSHAGAEALSEPSSGEYFCETSLVRERKAMASVEALETTELLVIPRTSFQDLTRRFPKLGRVLHTRLLESFGKRLDEATETV